MGVKTGPPFGIDDSCWTSMYTPAVALRGYARPPEVDARVIRVDAA